MMTEMRVISGEPDAAAKCCTDCRFMQAALTWWCVNDQARKARGTCLPGICGCPFWQPAHHYTWRDSIKSFLSFGLSSPLKIRCGTPEGNE